MKITEQMYNNLVANIKKEQAIIEMLQSIQDIKNGDKKREALGFKAYAEVMKEVLDDYLGWCEVNNVKAEVE